MLPKSEVDVAAFGRLISEEYYDTNGITIEVLNNPPTALQFARLVHISRPVIIRGFEIAASRLWTNDYLIEKMGNRNISVAVTPDGFADAIVKGYDGLDYFAEPYVEKMTMQALLNKLNQEEQKSSNEVHYLQSQNGNLFARSNNEDVQEPELQPLKGDVPRSISWCSNALDQEPEAVNVWVGSEASITSIHGDPYENIYTVVRGEKHFTLLPPVDSWCVEERYYPHASYKRDIHGELTIDPSDPSVPHVRWSSLADPDDSTALPETVRPIRITLRAGETLYLPVGWWHYVRQSGLTIAVNWWYDAELRGMPWVLLNVLRNRLHVISANENDALQ